MIVTRVVLIAEYLFWALDTKIHPGIAGDTFSARILTVLQFLGYKKEGWSLKLTKISMRTQHL